MTKIPPHNLDAERGLLGCCLLSPKECLAECQIRFNGAEVFYDLRNQALYDLMIQMNDDSKPVDVPSVWVQMKESGLADLVEFVYLNSLPDSTPSSANVGYYSEIVLEKKLLRDMAQACESSAAAIYASNGEGSELLDEAEKKVLRVRQGMAKNNSKSIKEIVLEAVQDIERIWNHKGQVTGISTGFPDLDELTDGLQPKELTLLAAPPSAGKTALAMNMVEHAILNLALSVGVFSLEMSAKALIVRMLLSRARANGKRMKFWTERNFQNITTTAHNLAKTKLHIEDIADTTISQLRAQSRRIASQHSVKMFVIDYLQLVHGKGETRNDELGQVASEMKAIAKELDCHVLVLSQVTKTDKETKIRGTGDASAHADNIFVLDTKHDESRTDSCPSTLWIKKQRNGPANVPVELLFQKCYTRFESTTKTQP